MKVKADRDEASSYTAMLTTQDVAEHCKELGDRDAARRIRKAIKDRTAALAVPMGEEG